MNAKTSKFDKFVFETDFFEMSVNENDKAALTDESVAQAQSKGYAEGLEKGQQQANELFHSELASYLTPLKEKLEQFANEKSALHKIMEKRSVAVVSQIVQLLFKHLEKELGEETLAAAISKTLEKIIKDVHIVIKVNQKAYDFLENHSGTKELLAHKDARLKVNEELARGECSIEWEEAGAEINLPALAKEIQATLYDILPEIITATNAVSDAPAPVAEPEVEEPVKVESSEEEIVEEIEETTDEKLLET